MKNVIRATTESELEAKLRKEAYSKIEIILDSKGFSNTELEKLSIVDLRVKIDDINKYIANLKDARDLASVNYTRDVDFYLPEDIEPDLAGWTFGPERNLLVKKRFILDLIKKKSQENKINSISDLINNVDDGNIKKKLQKEIQDLKNQSVKIEKEKAKLNQEEKEIDSTEKQLEISKKKLELFEKKSKIWLTILAKESVASIIGALLLLIISICMIVAMFLDIDTTNIIESAFLLILGYFFGQAVTKK